MSRAARLLSVLLGGGGILVACTEKDDATTTVVAEADTGAETETETETGDPPAFEPATGTWSYEEQAVDSNTCDEQIASSDPVPASTFNLDYDGAFEFQIEQGEEDVVCELDGTAFTCAEYTTGPFQVPMLDAFISGAVRWDGEFMSSTIVDGTATSTITCTGSDCGLIANLPCSRQATWVGEFVN